MIILVLVPMKTIYGQPLLGNMFWLATSMSGCSCTPLKAADQLKCTKVMYFYLPQANKVDGRYTVFIGRACVRVSVCLCAAD